MRLPGTRYQEPGWEQVRKLLGQCSLEAFARCDLATLLLPAEGAEALAGYIDLLAERLHAARLSARAQAAGNSYGDSVFELALLLAYELAARPDDWDAFRTAVAPGLWHQPGGEALLRKKVNDMFALLRDKVDADNYQAACGRPCSPNRIYAYRMLDTAYGEIARLFAGWREHRAQVGAILGRPVDTTLPIEVRQLSSIAGCRPEWILRWSETLERFTGSPGPLHTRSKRFDSLKNNADKIGAMLAEIGDYEALSANRDRDWLLDLDSSAAWIEDYWRVLDESEAAATPGPDLILEALEDELDAAAMPAPPAASKDDADENPVAVLRAQSVSLPPRFVLEADAAQEPGSWSARMLAGESLAVRLAVYLNILGPVDDSYPDAWRDPATNALPTMAQLAALDAVSLPTLRKRRDAAIARLGAANQSA
ncbi:MULTISPECIES: hypothetical protein [unclassified Massilia]|uniref:hypothetical protein n=1 Tax=unclassified Massilia TaxID=2609279 RepID=UPI00178641F2|nr:MULTISPECIES: hypothetical protein [unclassified Massilia]MBD8532341.1 hypothetical protein [Massilia sp. CFBP 13647]MBD8673786.1 hypothetical protein [Massilia sp. CFBP 13721]